MDITGNPNQQGGSRSAPRTQVQYLSVDAAHVGRRIDNFLGGVLATLPKARIYRVIRRGEVRVNGRRIAPSYRLRAGDIVRIPPVYQDRKPPAEGQYRLSFDLGECQLHEDEKILAINKPSGLAVHGGTGLDGGLITEVRAQRPDLPYLELAHRLDRETSGCLLLAKSHPELRRLHDLFRQGGIRKRYLGLVNGHWGETPTVVTDKLKRSRKRGQPSVAIAEDGKLAQTSFRPLEILDDASLLEVEMSTGRTHQIRVHAAGKGHPLAGDRKYGDSQANKQWRKLGLKRLFLHAAMLQIPAADGADDLVVDAPLPSDLREFLSRIS